MEVINNAPNAPSPVGPYSQATVVGELVFTAGQIGIDSKTSKLVQGIEAQTVQVLNNLNAVLEAAGSSLEQAALVTIFLSDLNYAPQVNEIYAQYVSRENPPARQTVAVKALPLNALVEISIIAERI